MELLYIWINQSVRKVIEKQGFNFSPEFQFNMEFCDGKWRLIENTKWKKKSSIFHTEIVENLTAVVGKNGVGKTTFLNQLLGLNCGISTKVNYSQDGYEELYQKEAMEDMCLFVMRSNCNIAIYHNLEKQLVNQTAYKEIDMTEGNRYRDVLNNQNEFKDITKIYITNSNYTIPAIISTQEKLDELVLSPTSLSILSRTYYKKLLHMENRSYKPDADYLYRNIIRSQKEFTDFQQICDVLYLNELNEKGVIDSYLGKVSSSLEISVQSCGAILKKENPAFHDDGTIFSDDLKNEKCLYRVYRNIRKNYKDFFLTEHSIIRILMSNLVFEVCIEKDCEYPRGVNNFAEIKKWIQEIGEGEKEDYFMNAVAEITRLYNIISKGKAYHNLVPKMESSLKNGIIFDYSDNRDTYNAFLNFIAECFEHEYSFVLRYLKIKGLEMSSGERAFQNFFSWINLVPQFHKISVDVPPELKSTILLLIDEIDLYLHPEWQVKFIKNMLSELEWQFEGKKIQIVFTTHSPLCLSDVPRENTIYLSDENTAICQDRTTHRQTFGQDIYTLLNDAFYLKDCTMGAFAEVFINNIIYALYDKEQHKFRNIRKKEADRISEQIQYIGNEVLRKKLSEMLSRCLDKKEDKIQHLLEEQKQIQQRLDFLMEETE